MLSLPKYHPFEQDSRLLVISAPEDFKLYRLREKLKINGLIFPYPIKADVLAAAELCAKTRRIPTRRFITHDGNFEEIDIDDKPELEPLKHIASDLKFLFYKACGQNSRVSLRVNSNYPIQPHQHRTALTLTFLGSGTVCYDLDNNPYAIPANHALICEDIKHNAPQNFSSDNPRCNFVVIMN